MHNLYTLEKVTKFNKNSFWHKTKNINQTNERPTDRDITAQSEREKQCFLLLFFIVGNTFNTDHHNFTRQNWFSSHFWALVHGLLAHKGPSVDAVVCVLASYIIEKAYVCFFCCMQMCVCACVQIISLIISFISKTGGRWSNEILSCSNFLWSYLKRLLQRASVALCNIVAFCPD